MRIPMTVIDRFAQFTPLDGAAVVLLVVLWAVIGWRVEHPGAKAPSTSVLMAGYRRMWMKQMIDRDPRIFDAQILGGLRQGTAFFASTRSRTSCGTRSL